MIILLLLKIILVSLLVVSFLLFFTNLVGFFIPRFSHVSITNSYFHPPETLWDTLFDFKKYPAWRHEILKVEEGELNNNSWSEFLDREEPVSYEIIDSNKNKILIIRTTNQNLPIDLIRKFIIWRQDYMSFLKVEDQLIIKRPHLRCLSRILFDHPTEIRKIMHDLDEHLDKVA